MTSITVEIFCSALYTNKGVVLDGAKRAEIASIVNSEVMPTVEKILSYDDFKELSVLNFEGSGAYALFDTYLSVSAVLGSQKAGSLFYELALVYFEHNRKASIEKYAQYGNAWNLDDAQRYERQYNQLKSNVRVNDFALVMSVISLCATTADVMGDFDDISVFKNKGGSYMLTFLRRQSALLSAAEDRESLAYAGMLAFEFVFNEVSAPEGFTTLEASEWYALARGGEQMWSICSTLPELFSLYSAFANTLTLSEAELLYSSENQEERRAVVLTVLDRCRSEFVLWADKLAACSLATDYEKNAIYACGASDEFYEYANTHTALTPSELAALISECAAAADGEAQARLEAALESFMFSVAPYVTYVYYGKNNVH